MKRLAPLFLIVLALGFAPACASGGGDDDPQPKPDTTGGKDTVSTDTAGNDTAGNDTAGNDTPAQADTTTDTPGPSDATANDGTENHDTGPQGCVSDLQCDDGDLCTIDTCDAKSGFCAHEPDVENPACGNAENSPCEESDLPGTSDSAIQDCVCANDSFCCDNKWDSLCVKGAEDCGALCGCKDPTADLTCGGDADCAWCNDDNDLCAGKWTCIAGTCTNGGPVVCDTSGDSGCLETECNSFSGECEQAPNSSLCDDQDFCTTDSCNADTGQCTSEALEGCGTNPPCQSASTPGSSDAAITQCVCDLDDFCCTDWFGWGDFCVQLAEENCGLNCDCSTLPAADLACTTDDDCGWCGTNDPCDGVWSCVNGTCSGQGAVVCDTSADKPCLKNLCDPETVHCEMTLQPWECGDDDKCTDDVCDEVSGLCTNQDMCGTNSPCDAVGWPGSNNPEVTECVCNGAGNDPYCCETAWDGLCVSKAEMYCGHSCDCSAPETDLSCTTDDDCGFCNEDVCEAIWSCQGGKCTAGGPLVCESSGDQGCLMNTCNSFTGGCDVIANVEGCNDNNTCTADQCDGESGGCKNTPIPGCMGEPAFECKGAGEPSADGCAYVDSYEGCCDPWGRAIWCSEDAETGEQKTYCLDCANTNAFCGWSNIYYACGTEGEASEDPEFPMQCPGLNYAP